jgi:glycosyltransferase involved in cell wall biosynthesis
MKIGIEAQRIFRKKKHGMDMVALELIRNLQELDHTNEYVIFAKPDADNEVIRETSNFRIVRIKNRFYPFWEQVLLPRAASRAGCDVLHCTSNTAPVISRVPVMTILHDIIYLEKSLFTLLTGKGTAYQKFGNLYRSLVVPRVVKKSRVITTVSEFEKNRIGSFFGLTSPSKLHCVYNGVGSHFKPVSDPVEKNRLRMTYNLPENYVFFLGNTDPKKNTKGTLQAFSLLLKETGMDLCLVMVDFDRRELEKILDGIGDSGLMSRIVLTGYVVNTDLPGLYSLSRLFLYTSLRESFGIPMLEAMACGVPVITSTTSSMPEVAGGAALLTDPANPAEIAEAMKTLLTHEAMRESLIRKGLERSAAFSWKAMASGYLHLYENFSSL